MSTFDSMPLEEQPDGFGGLPALWRGAGHCRLTGGQPALAGPDGQNERWLASKEGGSRRLPRSSTARTWTSLSAGPLDSIEPCWSPTSG
jgi:hypothetical protein